jgi:hypothetical protein
MVSRNPTDSGIGDQSVEDQEKPTPASPETLEEMLSSRVDISGI